MFENLAQEAIRRYNTELEKITNKQVNGENIINIASSSSSDMRRSHLPAMSIEFLLKRFAQFALVQYKLFPLNANVIKDAEYFEDKYGMMQFKKAEEFLAEIRNNLGIRSMHCMGFTIIQILFNIQLKLLYLVQKLIQPFSHAQFFLTQ